jgi:hypothetical protein
MNRDLSDKAIPPAEHKTNHAARITGELISLAR